MKKTPRYPNDVLTWLNTALDDQKWAEDNFKLGYYAQVCFICQQIAEKALKALLLFNNVPVPRTHDLPRLLKKILKFHPESRKLKLGCEILNQYYAVVRYPDFGPIGEYTKKQAGEALDDAHQILSFVQKKIKTG